MPPSETEPKFPLEGRTSVIPSGYSTLIEFSAYDGNLDTITFVRHDAGSRQHSLTGHSATMSNPGDLFVGHFEWDDDDPYADLIEFYEVTIPNDVATVEISLTDDVEEEASILTANPISPGDNWKYMVPICVAEGEQVVVYGMRNR